MLRAALQHKSATQHQPYSSNTDWLTIFLPYPLQIFMTKILFICGALEYGCNGVGDYTRRLAAELMKQGLSTAIVAWHDTHVNAFVDGVQEEDKTIVPVLRIPASYTPEQKIKRAKKWITEFDPDWCSVQFVPFAYHKKGLPFNLAAEFIKAAGKRKWQIMFHELWVGMSTQSSMKEHYWGVLQKRLIKRFIQQLQPTVIHTQTSLYKFQLEQLGFRANLLPLFPNISVTDEDVTPLYHPAENIDISIVLFGNIHPGAPAETLAKEAADFAANNNKKLQLFLIGHCGAEKEKWINAWQQQNIPVKSFGEQSPHYISYLFKHASVGIATTPLLLIEKSGSVAAMREHGLPVICAARPWQIKQPVNFQPPQGIMEYREGNLEALLKETKKNIQQKNLAAVSELFMKTILSAN